MKELLAVILLPVVVVGAILASQLLSLEYARGQVVQSINYNNPLMGIRFNFPADWNFTGWYGFEQI
ncbi:MAG: hypothetical protein WA393_13505 [Nitrososphaeraceae archaeon]